MPSKSAVKALNELSNNPNNIVFLISHHSKEDLHNFYALQAPHLGLGAENSFFWRYNSIGKSNKDWNQLVQLEDFEWIK